MDILDIAISKAYVSATADSLGSLTGAPCTIKSTNKIDGETTVIFEWEGTSGATETSQISVSDGKSAYQLACDNGFIGTEQDWLDSLKADTVVVETIVQEEVTKQIDTQLQDTIQEKVDQAVSDALGGGSEDDSTTSTDEEIDSWF